MNHTESQNKRLKAYLDKGHWINPLGAFIIIGTFKLSTRIGEIAKDGYKTHREWTVVKNRFGEEIRVMRYRKA